jgi:hypothetical protein
MGESPFGGQLGAAYVDFQQIGDALKHGLGHGIVLRQRYIERLLERAMEGYLAESWQAPSLCGPDVAIFDPMPQMVVCQSGAKRPHVSFACP